MHSSTERTRVNLWLITSGSDAQAELTHFFSSLTPGLLFGGSKPSSAQGRSLVSLCVGVLGEHLEDLIEDMHVIAPAFPSHVKVLRSLECVLSIPRPQIKMYKVTTKVL